MSASPTNGFGSHKLNLVFSVKKPADQLLIAADWEVVSEGENRTTFRYHFNNSKKGDDEAALFDLCHALLDGVDIEDFDVNWGRSVY